MRVVVIGGGTGSFTVLRGLKSRVDDLCAVVSMFDSGGSTGLLRDEFGILPTGDVRRCLVALAEENDNVLRQLFMFRFEEHSSLKGHSFGNLFLTALTEITGSEEEAIRQASKILRIKGKVLPVSFDSADVCAELENGVKVKGETNIDIPRHDPNLRIVKVWLDPEASANPEAADAILNADLVVIGPGDLYSSIIPNLLVKGIPAALKKSKAKKVYVCNLMTKPGETTSFKASDHLKEIIKYGCKPDVFVCNSSKGISALLEKYSAQNQFPVIVDSDVIKQLKVKLVVDDVMSAPELIRHDSEKLAELLLKI
ncbi:YvcK family protein [Candidatus Woesearchaeota archaeon]|nr:YvcK family protein [Candidatus Woesearchaeota archaeon]MBW3016324.1 YvcK family protein [Candidatus Woesearchaeota archaeon]